MKALAVFFLAAFTAGCATPAFYSPTHLAAWSHCDPALISDWIGEHIQYKDNQPSHWPRVEDCMIRGYGDCKCQALVAAETLNSCVSTEARIAVLQSVKRQNSRHAVAIYTDYRGRRGVISGPFHRQFTNTDTPWGEVVNAVPNGPWKEVVK